MKNGRRTYKTSYQQGFVDNNTGEIIKQTVVTEYVEGFRDVKLPIKKKLGNGNFIVVFQNAMLQIALHHNLFTRNEMTLLFYFLGTAGVGNSILIDYPTLVELLGIQRTNIVAAIRSLERKMIIVKSKVTRRKRDESQLMNLEINFDQLNYYLAYNGKFGDHLKLKYNHPNLVLDGTDTQQQKQKQLLIDFDSSISPFDKE